jgi:hypothetical protein
MSFCIVVGVGVVSTGIDGFFLRTGCIHQALAAEHGWCMREWPASDVNEYCHVHEEILPFR